MSTEATANRGWRGLSPEQRVATLCGWATALLGLAGLAGWVFRIQAFTRVAPGYKAVAPSVAICLIILGLILPGLAGRPIGRRRRTLTAAVVGVVTLFALLEPIGFVAAVDLNLEDMLTAHLARVSSIPFETMSPVAGLLLFLVGAAMLAVLLAPVGGAGPRRLRDAAGVLGVVAGIVALIFGLGYLYGAPLLYGGPIIPISVAAVLGGLVLAVGAVAAAGPGSWPLRFLVGDSARAVLLRSFLPLTVLVALSISAVQHRLVWLEPPRRVLVGSALAVIFAVVAGLVASRVAHSIGGTIDQAREAQQRAQSELDREARLLEAITENTEAHLVYLDPEFNFIWVNAAYARACRRPKEEFAGHNHFEFYPHAENEAIFRRVRDTGEPAKYIEKPFEFPDMPERGVTYWDWTLTPLKDESGAVEGLVFSLADVTERVRTREQLFEMERARARMAETMAAEINHRMKNNLAMVAELLQMGTEDQPAGSPGAELVREATARIRTVSEVHAQLFESGSDSLDLVKAVERVAEVGRQALSRGATRISVRGGPVMSRAKGAAALCACVNELVTNALKYGAPGAEGALEIEIGMAADEGLLRLSVWNSGNPVPAGEPLEREGAMGLRLIREIVVGQYRGSFTFRPHRGGSLAELVVDRSRLDEEG